MPRKQIIILIIFAIVISAGIIYVLPRQNNTDKNINSAATNLRVIECDRDSDCLMGGCSNTECLPRDKAGSSVTTCEWQDEYACYAKDACGCIEHQCQWANNEFYQDCLNKLL